MLAHAALSSLVLAPTSSDFAELHRALPPDQDRARDVALADLDGDGDLDAVFANELSGYELRPPRLYLNDGTGVFERLEDAFSWIADARAVSIGDLDGDGDPDVVVTGDGPHHLYFNDGAASFEEHFISDDSETFAVESPDVDGDGDRDLLLANEGLNEMHFNGGAAGFGSPLPFGEKEVSSRGLAVGDVDGDGDPDAVVANDGDRDELFVNDGLGGFQPAPLVSSPGGSAGAPTSRSLAAELADFDADGHLDLFIGRRTPEADVLLLNDGSGGFTDVTAKSLPAVEETTRAVSAADMDADGDVDVLTEAVLYRNAGAAVFSLGGTPEPLPSVAWRVATGDVDGDDDLDALYAIDGQNALYLNDGEGRIVDVPTPLPTPPALSYATEVGDLDGDGDLDAVMVAKGLPYDTFVLHNDGRGVFGVVVLPSLGGTDLALADLDLDGDLDAALAEEGDVLWNDGTGSFDETTSLTSHTGEHVGAGDLNGDGAPDLYFAGWDENEVFLNDGVGGFSVAPGAIEDGDFSPLTAELGDLDADGDLDALVGGAAPWGPAGGKALHLKRNDGSGSFSDEALDGTYLLTIDDLDLGDVDSDGDLDAVVAEGGAVTIQHLDNDGTGDLQEVWSFTGTDARSVALLDVDGDSLPDLLTGSPIGDPTVYYPNQGTGFDHFTDEVLLVSEDTYGFAAGDFDADDDVDVLVAAEGADRILSNLRRQLARHQVPGIGKRHRMDLYGSPGASWLLAVATKPGEVDLPPYGVLGLDPGTLVVVDAGRLDADGRAASSYAIPAEPALVGELLLWQALIGAPERLSNVVELVVTDL